MITVRFTKNLARHVRADTTQVSGAKTVREVLDAVFAESPVLRGYVLDDQGILRKHMVIFVRGEQLRDRVGLSDPVGDGDELDVMQALSGG
ncbi:MoaD/ThiS family protein [Myxococcota bacterium]|nr:MoaD/ThiS family protein [Myxococcota bacterium]